MKETETTHYPELVLLILVDWSTVGSGSHFINVVDVILGIVLRLTVEDAKRSQIEKIFSNTTL